MPASLHKIDFSTSAERAGGAGRLHPAPRQVIPFVPEAAPLPAHRSIATLPCYRRHEALAAMLITAGLHLAGFTLMSGSAPEEVVAPPAPIQVAWIAAPQPKSETLPAAPPKQQQPATKSKPKPKPKAVKRVKAKRKSVLSTHAPAAAMPVASAEKTETAPAPPVTPAPAAPAAPPAAPSQTADSRPPLTLPNLNADYLHNPAPPYPEQARERGEQGKVLVRALINTDGAVSELSMKRSSGFADLDRSALETVKKWRFVPARRGSEAVSAWVVVPITFSLDG
jgi:protein TonB